VIFALKKLVKSHWPRLRLRTILFGVLLFTAALPGFGTLFFRIYENTLVRQTESELIVQGAVMAAAYTDAAARKSLGATYGNEVKIVEGKARYPNDDFAPIAPMTDLSEDVILADRATGAACAPSSALLQSLGTEIAPVLKASTQTTLGSVRLTDAAGCVLAGRAEIGTSLAHVSEVADALSGKHSSKLRQRGGYQPRYAFEFLSKASAIRVSYASPIKYNDRVIGALLLTRSPRSLFKGLYQDIGKIVAAVAFIFLIVLALAGILSRSITKPVERLNDSIKRVARGERSQLEASSVAAVELQQLFANFEAMALTIEQRSTYIRDFAAAVSHEFKTPLTSISGALELLQDHDQDMPQEQRNKFLTNATADTERLNRLVGRLLELARADMLTPRYEVVNLAHMLAEIMCQHKAPGFGVQLTLADRPLRCAIALDVLETVILNLISNSKQHGATRISIRAERNADHILLLIADDGLGIPPEDRNKIFDAFFTSRRDTGGTGLGLSIAKSLLSAYGESIRLVPSSGGAAFEVKLATGDD
jgi:two-component system, OmpR family, sensor histidine kinase ChvG